MSSKAGVENQVEDMSTPTALPLGDRLADTSYVLNFILRWEHLVLLASIFIIFVVCKFVFAIPLYISKFRSTTQMITEFNLDDHLVEKDNKAIALALGGYILGLGFVVRGSLSATRSNVGEQLLSEFIWTMIGFILLFVSQLLNNFIMLHGIKNSHAMLEGNIAVGILEGGYFFI